MRAWDVHKLAIIGTSANAIGLASVCLCASIGVIMIAPGEEMVRAREGVRKQIDRILKRTPNTSRPGLEQVIEGFELAPNIEACVNSDMVLDLAGGSKTRSSIGFVTSESSCRAIQFWRQGPHKVVWPNSGVRRSGRGKLLGSMLTPQSKSCL